MRVSSSFRRERRQRAGSNNEMALSICIVIRAVIIVSLLPQISARSIPTFYVTRLSIRGAHRLGAWPVRALNHSPKCQISMCALMDATRPRRFAVPRFPPRPTGIYTIMRANRPLSTRRLTVIEARISDSRARSPSDDPLEPVTRSRSTCETAKRPSTSLVAHGATLYYY